jgi:hypothetical protein
MVEQPRVDFLVKFAEGGKKVIGVVVTGYWLFSCLVEVANLAIRPVVIYLIC